MNAIDRYLNEVCWAMGGTLAEQQAVRDELRAHILDEARELEMQGVPRDDAIARALGHLGDAEAVGRSMRRSRGTAATRRPLVQSPGALVLERRSAYHLPAARVSIALAFAGFLAAAIAVAWLWPV